MIGQSISPLGQTVTLTLQEKDPRLANTCRSVEAFVGSTPELNGGSWSVLLLSTFNNQPEAQTSKAFRNSPAAFRVSTQEILMNDSTFWSLPQSAQPAVIAHELGH